MEDKMSKRNNNIVEGTLEFINKHKNTIVSLSAGLAFVYRLFQASNNNEDNSSGNKRRDYSRRELEKMSYNKLEEEREKVRRDTAREDWQETLRLFDSVLGNRCHPIREYAQTLSDTELDDEIEKAEKEGDYKKVYHLKSERQHRYAEAHPDRPRWTDKNRWEKD